MNLLHRHHFKATLWILSNPSFSRIFPTLPQSAVAFRLQGHPHFSRIHSHSHSLSTWSSPSFSLQATAKESRETIDNNCNRNRKSDNMIVRVRSNIGTAKLTIEDEKKATESTIRIGILEELKRKIANNNTSYRLTQDLSFDPAGVRRIHRSKTLSEQGIRHGCMVYCRVEEEEDEISQDDSNNIRSNDRISIDNNDSFVSAENNSKKDKNAEILTGKKEATAKKKDDVIDLIDSSDEEEIICIGKIDNDNNDDDDDDVQVISPKKMESVHRKNTADDTNATSKSRKRQRSAPTDGQQQHSSASNSMVASDTNPNFQIASYNVWFGPPDADAKQVFPRERMVGIVESLKVAACQTRERKAGEQGERESTCPLMFVGLQELTPTLFEYLQPSFQNMGYKLCTQPLGGFGPSYGIGIAVPADLVVLERQFVPYRNSNQGRGFLFVRTQKIIFVTTHLESWCGPKFTGSKEREVQIVEAANYCKKQLKFRSFEGLELAIIAGDLNWDDERKRKPSEAPNRNLLSILPDGWKDAGTPFDYTYDAKENPMLNGHLRRRLDRCIYLSASSRDSDPPQSSGRNYKSMELQKIGKESIPNLVWNKRNSYNDTIKKMPVNPSDHFGIIIPFSKK